MNRLAYQDLVAWKTSASRKPLVLYGARQVGKTWLLKELGKREFRRTVYVNFDKDQIVRRYFGDTVSPQIIIRGLENHFNKKIDPANTLLVFDEI